MALLSIRACYDWCSLQPASYSTPNFNIKLAQKILFSELHEVRNTVSAQVLKAHIAEQRYKGLGELEPSEMKELCTNPETRTAIIVKFKDIERDMEKINIIMSTNKKYMEARSRILSGFRADDLDIDT